MSAGSEQKLKEFMAKRVFCVISTVGEDLQPESAFVGYSCNDQHEIFIGTSNKSRKCKNIAGNNSIALVIADMTGEVQYEGKAEVVTSEQYAASIEESGFKKLPGFDKYRNDPTQVYLKIKPTWIRFIVHGDADEVTEFTEFA